MSSGPLHGALCQLGVRDLDPGPDNTATQPRTLAECRTASTLTPVSAVPPHDTQVASLTRWVAISGPCLSEPLSDKVETLIHHHPVSQAHRYFLSYFAGEATEVQEV